VFVEDRQVPSHVDFAMDPGGIRPRHAPLIGIGRLADNEPARVSNDNGFGAKVVR
jgi:hypothetical protein